MYDWLEGVVGDGEDCGHEGGGGGVGEGDEEGAMWIWLELVE